MKSCVITTDQDVENGIKVWVSLIDEILFTLKNKSRIICKGVCTKFTELGDASDLQLLHNASLHCQPMEPIEDQPLLSGCLMLSNGWGATQWIPASASGIYV